MEKKVRYEKEAELQQLPDRVRMYEEKERNAGPKVQEVASKERQKLSSLRWTLTKRNLEAKKTDTQRISRNFERCKILDWDVKQQHIALWHKELDETD